MDIELNSRFPKSRNSAKFPAGGKIFLTIFGLIFVLIGLAASGAIIADTMKGFQTRNWDKTACVITKSQVNNSSGEYEVAIEYRYQRNGKAYISNQFEYGSTGKSKDSVNQADALADQYPVGGEKYCFVNPEKPYEAVLAHTSPTGLLIGLLPLLFTVIGIFIIYAAWFLAGRSKAMTESLTAKSSKKGGGKVLLVGFFLIFFLAGFAFGYFFFFPAIYKSLTSGNWIKTECVIQSSQVGSHSGDDSTTYSIDIVFAYTVNGKKYRSDTYQFLGGSSSGYDSKAKVVKSLPKGKHTVCYVNPDNPYDAVLKREMGADMLFGLIPLIFMLVGFFGIVFTLGAKSGNRDKSKSYGVNLDQGHYRHREDDVGPLDTQPGQQVLKPKVSYLGKILGTILISLFWNGIVSVFAYQAVISWFSGNPEIFLTIFLIPFVLIGLAMIFGIFYFTLASFNPRPQLILLKDNLRIGDNIDMTWSTSGNVYRIQNFTLTLIGEESATYRRGTNTYTDTNKFYENVLVDSKDPEKVRNGSCTFHIPNQTMHSFKSNHNGITWKIAMHCDIPRWPDSREDFIVDIGPMKLAG